MTAKPYLGVCTRCGVMLVRKTATPEPSNLGYHGHPADEGDGGGFLVRVVYQIPDSSLFAQVAPEVDVAA